MADGVGAGRRGAGLPRAGRGLVRHRRRPRRRARPDRRRPARVAADRRAHRRRRVRGVRHPRHPRPHPRGLRHRRRPGRRGPARVAAGHDPRRRRGRAGPPRRSTGTSRRRRRAATPTSCSRRSTSSPQAIRETLRGRLLPDGRLHPRRGAADRRRAARRRQGVHRRLRHELPRRAGRPSTPSSTGRGCPVEIDIASEFRYRDPVLDAHTLVVGVSQSGETPRHDGGVPLRPTATNKAQGARGRATSSTRRWPGRPTPSSTRGPGPRSAWPPPRPTSPRSWPWSCWPCTSPSCGARCTRPRSSALLEALQRPARPGRRGAGPRRRVSAVAARVRRRPRLLLPRPGRRLPGRPRGRAQAQGDHLRPGRGLSRRAS